MVLQTVSYSYTVVSLYATTQAATAPAPAAEPVREPARRHDHHGHHGHRHGRGGGLVDAVRSALREGADAHAAGEGIDRFAQALWSALKPERPVQAEAPTEPRRYGDLVQRLDALAASVEKPAPADAATPLVEAFSAMLKAVKPASGDGAGRDARSLLALFLHRVATALDAGGRHAGGPLPAGQLVDATA